MHIAISNFDVGAGDPKSDPQLCTATKPSLGPTTAMSVLYRKSSQHYEENAGGLPKIRLGELFEKLVLETWRNFSGPEKNAICEMPSRNSET